MPVNKEELAKDLETPEYQTIVKETLAKKDFVIRTKEEETGFLDRFKADAVEKEIKPQIAKVHEQYDKDIKEVFGADREQNEKSYDYLKRVGKATTGELATLRQKVTTLEEDLKKGDPTGAIKKQLEDAENKFKAALAEKDKELNEVKSKMTITEKSAAVNSVYAGVKSTFKKDLPALFSRTEKVILEEAVSRSAVKEIQGKSTLIMLNSDGSEMKDSGFNNVTVEAWLKSELKEVIDPKHVQGGAGSQNKQDPNKEHKGEQITAETFVMPDSVKTKDDLMTYMLSIGMKRGEKNFNDVWAKFSKEIKVLA